MNLVALLIAPAVVALYLAGNEKYGWGIAIVALLIVAGAIIIAKSRPIAVGDDPELEHILEDIDAAHHPELHHETAGDGGTDVSNE